MHWRKKSLNPRIGFAKSCLGGHLHRKATASYSTLLLSIWAFCKNIVRMYPSFNIRLLLTAIVEMIRLRVASIVRSPEAPGTDIARCDVRWDSQDSFNLSEQRN
jgi:hypothetical protein